MKNRSYILGLLFFVLANAAFAQSPFLTYRFANAFIKPGTLDTLIFEVQAKCDVPGTYHTELSVYLNYNPSAFGNNVAANNKIFLERTGLTAEELVPGFGIYKYNFLPLVDNTSSRVVFGTEPPFASYSNMANLTQVPATFTPYMKVKMVIADENQNAGITFEASLMNGNQYYLTAPGTPIPYGTCVFNNTFEFLPLNPNTNLLISEVADPSNSSANFVEIYNAGASSVDFEAYYAWYLNFNGTSGIRLTGSLPAGGKYIVAENAANFNAAYPGKAYNLISSGVGTTGNINYLLTVFGDYASGTAIDTYNGAASGFDYTGKHAVRKYPVVSPNPVLTASEWILLPAANMDMTPGSHRATLVWDGSLDVNWSDTTNWTPSYVPDPGHNAQIPSAVVPPPTLNSGAVSNCHDVINGAAEDK